MIARPPVDLVILGGGTAGWMAANLFATRWPHARVTLVESPDVGIIGVGEGSTPQLKRFFDTIGLREAAWMPHCNATFKNGIAFEGWSRQPGYQRYFHPFPTDLDSFGLSDFYFHCLARRTGRDVPAHPDRFFLQSVLAAQSRAPLVPENFPFAIGYGYHFDAHLVGQVLQEHALSLGVRRVEGHVTHATRHEGGDIASLMLRDGSSISGDFFVDCSGFRAALIGETLGETFLPFAENLFNDAAVVMPTGVDPDVTPAQTRSTALSSGWAWAIPLTNRTGNGYVYASNALSADAAETELRAHLGLLDSETPARHLSMRVGRVAKSWSHNCLALGLAQGFIEPLEATALHIVQTTVEQFIEAVDHDGFGAAPRERFNDQIAARYEGIRDYIVAHYRLNQRGDNDYWRANAANQAISDSLRALMSCWFRGGDLVAEIEAQQIGGYYSAMSWHCLFAGYGTFPEAARLRAPEPGLMPDRLGAIDEFIRRCALNFDDHHASLAALAAVAS